MPRLCPQVPGRPPLRIGRAFGAGFLAQNTIYQLLREDGRHGGAVLKASCGLALLHSRD